MPQFALKEMFVGMGLIAAGLSMVIVSISPIFAGLEGWGAGVPIGLWYVGGMYVGAGALAPFKKPWIGAWIGIAVLCLYDLHR